MRLPIQDPRLQLDEDGSAPGHGYWTRQDSEGCLLATRCHPRRLRADVRQGIREPRRRHSEKPVCIHKRIDGLAAVPYCELFGRQAHPGWTVWGYDVESPGPAPTEEAPASDEVSAERPSSMKGVRTGADGVKIRL